MDKIILHSLNIRNAVKKLTIEALSESETIKEAAYKLGITERTLYSNIRSFDIRRIGNQATGILKNKKRYVYKIKR